MGQKTGRSEIDFYRPDDGRDSGQIFGDVEGFASEGGKGTVALVGLNRKMPPPAYPQVRRLPALMAEIKAFPVAFSA